MHANRAMLLLSLDESHNKLAHQYGTEKLAYTVGALKVAIAYKDHNDMRLVNVFFALALLEVVHIEEHTRVGDHQHDLLLNEAHLILAGAPHVRQEEMKVTWLNPLFQALRTSGNLHRGRGDCGHWQDPSDATTHMASAALSVLSTVL